MVQIGSSSVFIIFVSLLVVVYTHRQDRLDTKDMDKDFYCKGRSSEDFFRRNMSDAEDFRDYRYTCNIFYRCIPAAGGKKSISAAMCQSGMFFDIEQQICKPKRDVFNCDQLEKYQPPLPRWPLAAGEQSNCEGDKIQCGSGECLDRKLFCDEYPDCLDGSDENACGPELDPNAAPRCDPRQCNNGNFCYCSVDGTRIPADLTPEQTPQMILITFSGAVNERNFKIFDELFSGGAKNKGNDCSVKATFFVSHAYTNYSGVQELHRRGHEIATHSITSQQDYKYWTHLPYEDYSREFEGNRLIIEKYANITQGEVIGVRVPQGRVGGNPQFEMMSDFGFMYDSSLAAARGRLPLWPYDLTFRMPHKCLGIDQNCPSRNYTVWEMVMNELDRRDDPDLDEKLTGCYYIDQCTNIQESEQFRRFLNHNLAHHYNTNRAPLGLHFSAGYFETRQHLLKVFKTWIRDISQNNNYYFVTNRQALLWMLNPTDLSSLSNFNEWRDNCVVEGLPYCSLPNPCPFRVPRIFPNEDNMYLYTCEECPRTYPWLDNPTGNDGFNDIF